MPGGGRNGDGYRDKWIKSAEKYNILILSPSYSDENYPGFQNYNLGGTVLTNSSMKVGEIEYSQDPEKWIFNDFDRLFEIVKDAVGSTEETYDIFGHSAGGQIVHRFILFHPDSKVNRALAANSGWYTTVDFEMNFPYGLKESPVTQEELVSSMKKNLVVFLGALDDENETNGHLRTGKEVNKQGPGRVQRGSYFFRTAQAEAQGLNYDFNWQKYIVPSVGHSSTKMSAAAAKYLYSE